MFKLAVVLCSILLASASNDIFLKHIETNKLMDVKKIEHTVQKLNNILALLDNRTEQISQTIFNETYIIIKNTWRLDSEMIKTNISTYKNDLSINITLNSTDFIEKNITDIEHEIKKTMECVTQRYEYDLNGIKKLENLINMMVGKINNSTENVRQKDDKNLNVKSTIDAILNSRAAASLVSLNAIPVFQRSEYLLQNLTKLSTFKYAIAFCVHYTIPMKDTQGHNGITRIPREDIKDPETRAKNNINRYSFRATTMNLFSNGFVNNTIYPSLNAVMSMYMASSGVLSETEQRVQNTLGILKSDESSMMGIKILSQRLNNLTSINFRMENRVSNVNNDVINKYFEPFEWEQADIPPWTPSYFIVSVNFRGFNTFNNRLELNATWGQRIVSAQTARKKFFTSNGTVYGPTMYYSGTGGFGRIPNVNARILKLDFEGNEASMFIIYPYKIKDLAKLRERLNNVTFEYLTKTVKNQNLSVCLPKFDVHGTNANKSQFQSLDLVSRNSDSQDSSDGIGMEVDALSGGTSLEIDEKGLKVAGEAKRHSFVTDGYYPKNQDCEYHVKRPFICLIVVYDVLISAAFISNPFPEF